MLKTFMSIVATGLISMASFGSTSTSAVKSDVYNFVASLKVPTTSAGLRDYKTYVYRGYLYIDFDASGNVSDVYVESTNSKLGTLNIPTSEKFLAVLMGKNIIKRSSLYFAGIDDESTFNLAFSGYGSLKTIKVSSCGPCGTFSNCIKYSVLNGTVTGTYTCPCGDSAPSVNYTECPTANGGCSSCSTTAYIAQDVAPVCGTWKIYYKTSVTL